MNIEMRGSKTLRRGHTIKDVAIWLGCLAVAVGLLIPLAGAQRNLSRAQVCMDNLRQLFTGLTAYVNQYNSYPPHAPWPNYVSSQTIHGLNSGGWDPNIGWLLTYGLGLPPPATDAKTGHFIWYLVPEGELPPVCVCPARAAWLLVINPELDQMNPAESLIYQYALSYQTSGTCRAACPVVKAQTATTVGVGGRNPPIPDPTGGTHTAQQYDDSQWGNPSMWVLQRDSTKPPDDPTDTGLELSCWIQAINPSEVDHPARVYYMADGRDFRPTPGGYPPAGKYNGYYVTTGNKVVLGSRHYGWANVMYLDGRVSRDEQAHDIQWNYTYDAASGQGTSTQWRCATFATDIRLANIRTQAHIMPVLAVKGWEYFFTPDGLRPLP
jgi:prepilin-type processing-associated H-X9-DG protein